MTKEEFVLKYLGNLSQTEIDDLAVQFDPNIVCSGYHLGMINEKQNRNAISDMRNGFKQFWRGYSKLDPALWDYAELPSHMDLSIFYWRLYGEVPDHHSPIYGDEVLDLPDEMGALKTLERAIALKTNLVHHHAIRAGYPSKAALLHNANDLWGRYIGTKVPKKPSPGTKYYEYLADYMNVLGKNWSVQSVLRAAQRHSF